MELVWTRSVTVTMVLAAAVAKFQVSANLLRLHVKPLHYTTLQPSVFSAPLAKTLIATVHEDRSFRKKNTAVLNRKGFYR